MYNVPLSIGPVQHRTERRRGLLLMHSALILIRQGLYQLCRGVWMLIRSL
jgi:hypothetical protein